MRRCSVEMFRFVVAEHTDADRRLNFYDTSAWISVIVCWQLYVCAEWTVDGEEEAVPQ